MHVLAISGSLRRQSFNTALLHAAVELAPAGMTITVENIGDFPLYNDDVRLEGYPPVVQAFRDRLAAADALLMACPEYNYSVAAPLKNAIDWASRPPGTLFNEKPVAIVGAATGLFGSIRGQNHLRAILTGLNCNVLHKPEVMVASAASKIDAEGKLTDEMARKLIAELLVKLAGL